VSSCRTFKALIATKGEAGTSVAFGEFAEADLMEGDVTVRVTHSTLNYKDGLAMTGKAPGGAALADDPRHRFRRPGRDLRHPEFKPGDLVILNGWGTGETHLGAYARRVGSRATGWCRCPRA
jgi:acrylyl-CoA reductase (NADPH)